MKELSIKTRTLISVNSLLAYLDAGETGIVFISVCLSVPAKKQETWQWLEIRVTSPECILWWTVEVIDFGDEWF